MKQEELQEAIGKIRELWRRARRDKLARKRELLAAGMDPGAARRDPLLRAHRKIQRRCATLMRHLERRMNRMRAREEER
ncbi:MAG: hypothetical protein A2176_03915 [Spirochaetes bacterium RBG_13_51_14]|nr:MAG: hypothetical protein A2176_03915 [Spirochaetes bacterium RBG_13_51_14]